MEIKLYSIFGYIKFEKIYATKEKQQQQIIDKEESKDESYETFSKIFILC